MVEMDVKSGTATMAMTMPAIWICQGFWHILTHLVRSGNIFQWLGNPCCDVHSGRKLINSILDLVVLTEDCNAFYNLDINDSTK